MKEIELRKKCGLKDGELINTNLGYLDILSIKNDIVTLGILATGQTFQESAESIILKLKERKEY